MRKAKIDNFLVLVIYGSFLLAKALVQISTYSVDYKFVFEKMGDVYFEVTVWSLANFITAVSFEIFSYLFLPFRKMKKSVGKKSFESEV